LVRVQEGALQNPMSSENPFKSVHATETSQETTDENLNPNNIAEIFSFTKELETSSDSVYRSVTGTAAIEDLFRSGVVRNAQSAGIVKNNRWGTNVYWSRGAEGKYTNVQTDGYVIVAPHEVASQRQVRKEDVTAIYAKSEAGEVHDVLESYAASKSTEAITEEPGTGTPTSQERADLNTVRARLGLNSK
jgi:hypothetical protein